MALIAQKKGGAPAPSDSIPTARYRLEDGKVICKVFDLGKGEKPGKGWVDTPAKLKKGKHGNR